MATRDAISFCRICAANCGVVLKIDKETQAILSVKGDKDNPVSNGYVCFKGLQAEEYHHGPQRLLRPLKRLTDGSFAEIGIEQALDEIADKLKAIVAKGGPQAVAGFKGTAGVNVTTHMIQLDFLHALGSQQFYSVNTIDQSAKLVSFERQGGWMAGQQDLSQSEVILFFGCNPVISHSTMPVMGPDPLRTLKAARDRGLKLIVIDPRHTETAAHADLFLQPMPGRDTAIAAAMVRVILDEGWEDEPFVAAHVGADRIADLRRALEPFTPEMAERAAGLESGQIRAAAKLFAHDCRSGGAFAATGPSMAAFSNTMQHMVDTLNIVCGRYRRTGQKIVADMINTPYPVHAEVISPQRNYDKVPPSRIRGAGMLGFDRMASTLPEEILTPGEGQIRALLVNGSNPASCLPDQARAVEAFRSLDLLVTVEPYMTTTAQLSHYILPPLMMYERHDLPISDPNFNIGTTTWSRYAPPVIDPPQGSELVADWYPWWALGKRLGLTMQFSGQELDFTRNQPPSTEDMLALRCVNGRISFDALKADLAAYPSGRIYDHPSLEVLSARPEAANARFDVMPADVADELRDFLASDYAQDASAGSGFSHLMISRRMNRVMNTLGNNLAGTHRHDPGNPAFLHPDELAGLGLAAGDRVEIASQHGRIVAVAKADPALRRGVVSISHCWGGLPGTEGAGANTNLLIAADRDVQPINAMPLMSSLPVNLRKVA
ncbi:MAG: molybdopterin-dependent oxidoreductase [Novosphingobium sp.]